MHRSTSLPKRFPGIERAQFCHHFLVSSGTKHYRKSMFFGEAPFRVPQRVTRFALRVAKF